MRRLLWSLWLFSGLATATIIKDSTGPGLESAIRLSPKLLEPWIEELRSRHFPSDFLQAAVLRVSALNFVDDRELQGGGTAYYDVNRNALVLSKNYLRADFRSIKSLSELSGTESGTLAHELWHGYFWKVWKIERPTAYRQMLLGLDTLYARYPANAREEIHEEAYASYIGTGLAMYLFYFQILSTKTPLVRQNLVANPLFQERYRKIFAELHVGYYHSPRGELITANVPMRNADKENVLSGLWNSQLSGQAAQDFAENHFE